MIKEFTRAERISNWKGDLVTIGENTESLCSNWTYKLRDKCQTVSIKDGRTRNWVSLALRTVYKGFHCVRETEKSWDGLWTDLVIKETNMRSLKSLGRLTKGRVIHKNTRNLWVATLHCCEEVERMRKTTNANRQSN